jgi:hypothetical protein
VVAATVALVVAALAAASSSVGSLRRNAGCPVVGAAFAGEVADGRVRARVAEATDPAAPAARREELAAALAGEPAAALSKALREAVLSNPRRPLAIDLASRLRVPGVFASAKRYAEGPSGAAVAALALADGDPASRAWLVSRWRTAAPDSPAFRDADSALRTTAAPIDVVDGVAASLPDPARGAAALDVLRFQMAVDDARPADLAARWQEARARYAFESKEHAAPGRDLLAAEGWRLRGARRVGANLRIAAGSCVDLPALPGRAGIEDGALRLAVAAPGGGAAIVVRTEDGRQELNLRSDRESWFLLEGPPREGDRVTAPFVAGAWAQIELRVRAARVPGTPGARDVRVLVDGRELRPSGGFWRLASPPRSLSVVAAAGVEPTLAGGIRWSPGPP